MGRPRKSPKLRVIDGDKPSRARRDEPRSPPGLGDAPPWFDGHESEAWLMLKARMGEMGLSTRADEGAAVLFCTQYALFRQARAALVEDGLTVSDTVDRVVENQRGIRSTTTTTTRPHPMLKVVSDTSRQMARLLAQFGMNPAARSALHVQAKEEDDELLSFLAGGKSGTNGRRGKV